ncbi:hypothetical protein [Rhodothermus marinus]|uniref:hypothetical protein n=1 Tax=Rhodothermus marinus TaxID=29549 RepID=UPI000A5A590F|nr:hypothetical protein [Rhodothermus marinus]
MLYVYFGHHKCASTWIHEIIGQVCREAGLQKRLLVDPLTPHAHGLLTDYRRWDIRREELGAYLTRAQVDFACCITADRAHVEGLTDVLSGLSRDPGSARHYRIGLLFPS